MIRTLEVWNEESRLAALRGLGVLDTPADQGIDSVTRHIAKLWNAPVAAVSLLDEDRQWFKSRIGLNVSETPRSVSFCAHLLSNPDEPFVVNDAWRDKRFAGNPLVVGDPKIRFYAGASLRDEVGHVLGALCVIDRRPRNPDAPRLHALKEMAMTVSSALVLHRSVHQLEVLLETDYLTGILNRKGFEERLSKTGGAPVCLMLLDLDNFKQVNDSFGHPAGDVVLREAARRIGRVLRRGDTLARLGGDEFAVILKQDCTIQEALTIAERIHQALVMPFVVGSTPLVLAASIGLARDSQSGMRHGQLYASADAALYAAKSAGRSQTRVSDSGSTAVRSGLPGHCALAGRLQAAVRDPDRAFRLEFQPIFDMTSGEATSVEALIRWSLDGQAISPAIFIPLAESLGIAPEIDRFVLRAASAIAARWPAARRLAVNLSAMSFVIPSLEDELVDLVSSSGFDHSRLTVELTETALSIAPDQLRCTLDRLSSKGVCVALDDFGAGQTSLAQLRHLALRTLKIDRVLVHDAANHPRGEKILESIAGLGRALELVVVAEGIETLLELALVRRLAIPRVQGFLLSAPVPAAELEEAIRAGRELILANRVIAQLKDFGSIEKASTLTPARRDPRLRRSTTQARQLDHMSPESASES